VTFYDRQYPEPTRQEVRKTHNRTGRLLIQVIIVPADFVVIIDLDVP
jgi:hypothetical protein